MMKLRKYTIEDASTILSWCKDDDSYFKWCAGTFGTFPVTDKQFDLFVKEHMPFTFIDDDKIVGFTNFRFVEDYVRFGFVIVDPSYRSKGYGKKMLELCIDYAFNTLHLNRIELGVFKNNPSAHYCYKSVGFKDISKDYSYTYNGITWDCFTLELMNK